MVSLFILGVSAIALIQFAIHQWRAIWISSASQPLSESLHVVTGLDHEVISAADFPSLVGMYDRICPGQRSSTPWLREITRYYWVLSKLKVALSRILPSLSAWATNEMRTCSRWVAVVIDQHLSVDMDRRSVSPSS